MVWLSRELWLEFKGKRKVHDLFEEGAGNSGRLENVMRLCREKIRAATQLELNPASAIKDNKYISNKRRARENVQLLLNGGRRGEET